MKDWVFSILTSVASFLQFDRFHEFSFWSVPGSKSNAHETKFSRVDKELLSFFDPSLRFHEFSFEKHVIAVQANLANGKTNFLESSQLEFS